VNYEDFIAGKLKHHVNAGLTGDLQLPERAFPFQRDLVTWALRRGRAAIFASTGLGKTLMQLAWASEVARHTQGRVLVLAPLAVGQQTADEAARAGIDAVVAREQSGCGGCITITNYDRLRKFDGVRFQGVVLDESSVIKHHDAKTFTRLVERFKDVPYRLAATATPAPNDYTELGTHAEFLGVCSRTEMLAEFFCHDGGDTSVWRLKGHARSAFWRWVASWGALVRTPSDLGYEDGGYALPPLVHHEHLLPLAQKDVFATGSLFAEEAAGLMARRQARRASLDRRVAECVRYVTECTCGSLNTPQTESANTQIAKLSAQVATWDWDTSVIPESVSRAHDPTCNRMQRWLVWCDLNDEQDAIKNAIGDECTSIYGSLDIDEKEGRLQSFIRGQGRVLLGKPSIFGFGINLQMVDRMAFVGVTDSFEKYFQAVRRCWRFGQKRQVHVHVFASEAEGSVVRNLKRKEEDAGKMGEALSVETAAVVRAEVRGLVRSVNPYTMPSIAMPQWLETHE
jgi:superfamily II DNA or RNA helicase